MDHAKHIIIHHCNLGKYYIIILWQKDAQYVVNQGILVLKKKFLKLGIT
jgi:hypothetical protein